MIDAISFHEADVDAIISSGDWMLLVLNRYSDERSMLVPYGILRIEGVSIIKEEERVVESIAPPFDDGEIVFLRRKEDGFEFLIEWDDYKTRAKREIYYLVTAASATWFAAA